MEVVKPTALERYWRLEGNGRLIQQPQQGMEKDIGHVLQSGDASSSQYLQDMQLDELVKLRVAHRNLPSVSMKRSIKCTVFGRLSHQLHTSFNRIGLWQFFAFE